MRSLPGPEEPPLGAFHEGFGFGFDPALAPALAPAGEAADGDATTTTMRYAVGSSVARHVVLLDFGDTPVIRMGMTPDDARRMAASLLKHANRAAGEEAFAREEVRGRETGPAELSDQT